MRLEQYKKLSVLCGGIDKFRDEHVKSLPVDNIEQYEKSQVRAAGHVYHNIQAMVESLKSKGQIVPASASIRGTKVFLEDGNTRLEALRRIQKETGEQQTIDVSFYHQKQGLSLADWQKFKFVANAHIPSWGNTKEDLLKVAGELYSDGEIDKALGICYNNNEENYLDLMVEHVHEDIALKTFSKSDLEIIRNLFVSNARSNNLQANIKTRIQSR